MIQILNIDKVIKEEKLKGPITSPQYYIGKFSKEAYTFHPEGLFSEEIFGLEGSSDRRKAKSWIDLNCDVIHPAFYDILEKKLFRKIPKLLSGEKQFKLDDNGLVVEADESEEYSPNVFSGMSGLIKNIKKMKFREDEEDEEDDSYPTHRNQIIKVVYDNIQNGDLFLNKLLVITPEYREIFINEERGKIIVNPINDIYKSIIVLSNQIKSLAGTLYDVLSYRMQLLIRDLYEFIKVAISKKAGLIRNQMLGTRVDLSARTVIVGNPELEIGEAGIPLRIICSLFEPHLIYGLVNSPMSNRVPQEFHDAVKEFLGKEQDPELFL